MAERKAFLLRMDPALWDALEALAQRELRSVNAQIEFLLRESLARRGVNEQTKKQARTATDTKR
ncbi:MAG: toxin-antitoxin system HicB family antitoxin [Betaproteobacteria bacterium]